MNKDKFNAARVKDWGRYDSIIEFSLLNAACLWQEYIPSPDNWFQEVFERAINILEISQFLTENSEIIFNSPSIKEELNLLKKIQFLLRNIQALRIISFNLATVKGN